MTAREPEPLPAHLEAGIDEVDRLTRMMLRDAGEAIPSLTDADLLASAALAHEKSTQESDLAASMLGILYAAEVEERIRVSRATDRRLVFVRKARRFGYDVDL